MDVPGLSIFQNGGESIQINNSANRLEEEEALEDQKRRNEELGNQLQNAFDDLIDDDDYTVDSSDIFQSRLLNNNGPAEENHNVSLEIPSNVLITSDNKQNNNIGYQQNNNNNNQNVEYLEEIEKYKKIIQSKDRELENITQIVNAERKKSDELTKRLALSEAEKSRAQMIKQQTHELLVESKAKCSEFENTISQFKNKYKNLEDNNTQLVGDLERTRNMLADVQQKYHMVEKNAGYTADRNTEVLIKQANERHSAQIEMMQQQLDNLHNKLDNKELELKTLDTRYKELQRNREILLIDKAETINQLAKSLEDSQRQCQHLISSQDYGQENIKLKRLVTALEKQTDDMQKTINNLTQRLDATTAELEIMDSVLHENVIDDDNVEHHITNPKRMSLTKLNLIGSNSTPLTSITTTDRLSRLKNELYRCMSSQKLKRDEIRKLQDQLVHKNDEIKNLKDDENKSLVQITTLKEENERLKNRLRILEQELDQFKLNQSRKNNIIDENSTKIRLNLENEIENLKEYNVKLKNEIQHEQKNYELLKEEKNKQLLAVQCDENERKRIDSQIKNLNIDLEEFKQEHESLKNNYQELLKENEQLKCRQSSDPLRLDLEKHKFLLKDAQKECDRVKNLYIEISNTKETISIELAQLKSSDLYKELHDEKQKSINLERALQLIELKNSELMKILEMEKTRNEQELNKLREQREKEKIESLKSPKNSSNNCSKCIEQISEVTKLEIQKIKLENQSTINLRQIHDLQLQVNKSQEIITDLNDKIALKIEQEKLIVELKEKAQQFENYMKSQNISRQSSPLSNCGKNGCSGRGGTSTSGISSSPKQIQSRDQSVETSPDLQDYNRRNIESKIRDEMAKIFAVELKNMEERFKLRLKDFETQNSQLKDDLQRINSDLKLRQNEVQLLKHAILSERDKMMEIIKRKDLEAEQIIQQQNIILHKCRDELNIKQNRIDDLIRELDDRNLQIEAERQSMKAVMTQWEQNNSNKEKNETDWRTMIEDLKNDQNKIIESLKLKYDSAKKTANNYKRYAEEKEKHMMEEYERIKAEYTLAKTKLESRYQEFVERKSKNMKQEITKIKLEYEEKLKNYQ